MGRDRSPSSKVSGFTTKELSVETWHDLETLFRKPGIGDAWWCWCTHHHVTSYSRPENQQPRRRAERAVRNHRKKRELIKSGRAHGILVYDEGEPMGWCQYGPAEELPRIGSSRAYRSLSPKRGTDKLWRITCFVVDKNHRKRGVASLGLKAVLDSIRDRAGGLVEAVPVSQTDQGPGYMCTGRVSMFEKAGFRAAGPFGTGRTASVLMRMNV